MNDSVQPAIDLLSFSKTGTVTNPRAQHVLSEIDRLHPERVIIVGGWDKSLAEQLRKSSLSEQYDIHVNDSCSLNWLRQTTATIRAGAKKAVVMSNFPREGNALNVCPASGSAAGLAIFFWGPYAPGYCNSVIRGQAPGKIISCQLLVDPAQDSDLLDKERKQLMACRDKAECQAVIQGILKSLEGDQNCPVANWGGVLV
ncbi:MAG: hypothetical protein NTW95_14385 [Candidatus Aminicenantes bacterium]|nr:hypothetical protein [Candidatus Aminicenantes bacterium]